MAVVAMHHFSGPSAPFVRSKGTVSGGVFKNWFQVIQECRDSGLTNREFCRQRGIPEKKFYYWLRKLRTQALEAAQPQIVPISPGAVAEDVLQIHFRGADLRLPGTVDLDAVAAVLRSIQTV